MPLPGKGHSLLARDEYPFFESLPELDSWSETASLATHQVIPHLPRPQSATRGRLLVCHDFKGGYSEKPEETAYTFNFWPLCDIFVYFSHNRVTIPPSGWISSAHRQGAKILGTLIFEHPESEQDCLRLLFGKLPSSKSGPPAPPSVETSAVPVSPHYARLLADIAYQRGFDGYLLNFEWNLGADSGIGQARALTAWILLLQAELKAKVGPHAEAIWYDSVIFNGQLWWQDRLNSYNLPFFLPSTGLFTNYTWPPTYPLLTAQFFLSIDPSLISTPVVSGAKKTLQDVYEGVDVWGRGSHGGGGFGSYRAIEHIDPVSLGLSVALFAPGWTWETNQDKAGFTWSSWWEIERRLWIGPRENVTVPPMPQPHDENLDPHGPFRPLSDFFASQLPPDPATLPFCTTFSPGVGYAWFVNGTAVMPRTVDGWTDIDKQSALGDKLWPQPQVQWEDREGTKEPVPDASSALDFDDAWLGGNGLRITFNAKGSDAEDAVLRSVWLPIQSLNVTPHVRYTARVIYKTDHTAEQPPVDTDVGLKVKYPGSTLKVIDLPKVEELTGGWTRQTMTFMFSEDQDIKDAVITAGLVVGFTTKDPSKAVQFSVLLGQLAVYLAPPTPSFNLALASPRILWADFQPSKDHNSGILTWELGSAYPPVTLPVTNPPVDSPIPLWNFDNSKYAFPSCSYFNIYAGASLGGPTRATFIGTTGLDGRANRFYVDWGVLPDAIKGLKEIRFFVQGVTDRGEVMEWGQCVFVDASR